MKRGGIKMHGTAKCSSCGHEYTWNEYRDRCGCSESTKAHIEKNTCNECGKYWSNCTCKATPDVL